MIEGPLAVTYAPGKEILSRAKDLILRQWTRWHNWLALIYQDPAHNVAKCERRKPLGRCYPISQTRVQGQLVVK